MGRYFSVLIVLATVIAIPFLLKPENPLSTKSDRTLVIITPHNEAIRQEFTRAFIDFWKEEQGETVTIDWRTPGGTSEIAMFLDSQYQAAFEYYWTHTLKRSWNAAVQAAFNNPRIVLPEKAAEDTLEQSARRAFLESNVGCGLDLFFGGGSYDFQIQANTGTLVDSGILQRHSEWFGSVDEGKIPQTLSGEVYWDADGRWVGTCLSAFGICYNLDVTKCLGLSPDTMQKMDRFSFVGFKRWDDLGYPLLQGQVALADPTKSGSVAKAFEMLLQQQIRQVVTQFEKEKGSALMPEERQVAIAKGWEQGIRLIIRIAANARYFTDAASKIPLDVSMGDAVAGMAIDFYGRFQSEATRNPETGAVRMVYKTPEGGSSIGVDPIGLLRGAPSPDLAKGFIDFVMSERGQKLWNYKPGTPGGPEHYALRRLPVQPFLYTSETKPLRSDPDVLPYDLAQEFTYEPEWTASLFRTIAFIVKVACLDVHDELRFAWRALIDADFPEDAWAEFDDITPIDYAAAQGIIRETLRSPDKLEEVRLAKELSSVFRKKYRKAEALAKLHKRQATKSTTGSRSE